MKYGTCACSCPDHTSTCRAAQHATQRQVPLALCMSVNPRCECARCKGAMTQRRWRKFRQAVLWMAAYLTALCCSGDAQKQQALLGQMLQEGYGCKADAAAGKEWADKARRRGYRMSGVYCEL